MEGMRVRARFLISVAACVGAFLPAVASAQSPSAAKPSDLLFYASGDKGLAADTAGGDHQPNFASGVTLTPDGASGSAFRWADDGYIAWRAPGNIYAQRGTLAFAWRPRTPLGVAPFAIFRVGFADHTSWDMAFLRIDWNGHGFDAFVTDANLARIRVSWRIDAVPPPDRWMRIAFSWDENVGVRLYVDGKEVARKDQRADLDSGLDQFGLAGRVISPHQVQSRYHFMRGSDVDEIRVYASAANVDAPGVAPAAPAYDRTAWLHRYGWDRATPPALTDASTTIRKIEFADARDLKEWMWKGVDGIAETTWPGVYNRSRLPGRDDYFELPDWNTYVEGGKSYVLTVPSGERFNRVELRGAAYGSLDYAADGKSFAAVAQRPQGVVRSVDQFAERTGGTLRFTNVAQETPIQELWAYDVHAGAVPQGTRQLSYTVNAGVAPASYAALESLNAYIAGRFAPAERATVVALPAGAGAGHAAPGAGNAAAGEAAKRQAGAPIVHVLIPSGFGDAAPGRPLARAWNYGWENVHDGLDGVALDLPALKATPGPDGLIALNIRVKDPIWPGRDMIDVSVSVKPGQPRTLWLDLRDRILTSDSLFLSIASSAPDFDAASIDGMGVRLVFKDRAEAIKEHVADRFSQVRDNWGFLVEEHTSSKREALYRRLAADIGDLLRVDPDHVEGRRYWADISYGATGFPAYTQPVAPAGVPLWAFRQLEDLKRVRQFVDWWIDERQVPYGDFGGGISDDVDLTEQWPGLALMGVEPDKVNASLRALSDAVYTNGMRTNGLGTITTDELHAYEEGLNSDAERLYLNWGEPRSIERLMATAKALQGLILRNSAGHMHFASNWYGGRVMYREGPWEWQKPYSFTVMHGPILLGIYNANPAARALVTGTIDGWMAHGKADSAGNWSYPNEINWRSDAERVGDGGGVPTPLQSAWAAWRFTGDAKYLRPILGRVAKSGPSANADLNENVAAALDRADWKARLVADAANGGDFQRYAAWDATGDVKWLEALHADAIADKDQHRYMYTEGHWWSDRVEQPNELLQRERLGGIALKRNQTWPGNTVSWRFAEPGAAERVALLVPGATPQRFVVTAWNTSDHAEAATMTSWNVVAGRWRMTGPDGTHEVTLERSASVPLAFPAGESKWSFELVQPGTPAEQRPDLGIGADDVVAHGGALRVTVHSLGAAPVAGGTLVVEGKDGAVLARATIPALAAPLDLVPVTTTLRLNVPAARLAGARVRVALPGDAPEVTRLNNVVQLP
jgi:hypothetical protein